MLDDGKLAVIVIQALISVILLGLGFVLKAIRDDLKSMAAKMDGFVTKEEANPKWARLHTIGDRLIVLEARAGMHNKRASDG